MATKIGLNEICPCGAGNLYQNCHHQIFAQKNWRALRDDAITEISDISDELENILNNDIQNLSNILYYLVNERDEQRHLPSHKISNGTNPAGEHVIIFNNTNLSSVKDSIIAHEFTHILLTEEGFPYFTPNHTLYSGISTGLNNLFQDPLIYPRLFENFSVSEDYILNVEELTEWLHTQTIPTIPLERVRWNFNFARTLLIQEALFNDEDATGINSFLEDNYSGFLPEVQFILTLFDTHGNDTPSRQDTIVNEIISHYSLNHYITVNHL